MSGPQQMTTKWGDDETLPEVELDREDDTLRARVGNNPENSEDRFVKVKQESKNHETAYIGYYKLKVPIEELEDYVTVLSELQNTLETSDKTGTGTDHSGGQQ